MNMCHTNGVVPTELKGVIRWPTVVDTSLTFSSRATFVDLSTCEARLYAIFGNLRSPWRAPPAPGCSVSLSSSNSEFPAYRCWTDST